MTKTRITSSDFLKLNLLATHASINAPHQARFHNFAADFEDMFPTPVGQADQRDDYRSALSPAAYLVDLVRLVKDHITPPDGLGLTDRRPDIYALELSQANAEQLVPYLEIANGVMQTYLEQTLHVQPSALQEIAQSYFPFDLPFHLPLTQIRAYLQHFKIDLAGIYAAFGLGSDDPAWVSETLSLAPGEMTYLATPNTTPDALNASLSIAYGVTISDASPLGGLDSVDTFLAQTGLTLEQLELLVQVRVPGQSLALSPAQLAEGQQPTSITNLTQATLDYLNRFMRLARRLGWSYDDLDWALASLPAPAPAPAPATAANPTVEIGQNELNQLAKIESLRNKYKLPVDVLCGLWSDLRTTAPLAQPNGPSLFDRIFNTPPLFVMGVAQGGDANTIKLAATATTTNGAYTGMQIALTVGASAVQTRTITSYDGRVKVATVDQPWTTNPDATSLYTISIANNPARVRAALQGALNVDSAACKALLSFLFPPDGSSLTLDVHTLTRLYRLSKLANVLGMPVTQYLALLTLITKPTFKPGAKLDAMPHLTTPEVSSLDDVLTVAVWADWLSAAGLNAFQVQYLTGADLSAEAARAVGQGLTQSALATAVGNYLNKITQWAVTPADFVHSGVDAKTATSIWANLAAIPVLDADGQVIQPSSLNADAVTKAIGGNLSGFQWADATTVAYIQAVVKTLNDALDQQTDGAVDFWSGVLGAEAASAQAALTYVVSTNAQTQTLPIAPALVLLCRVADGNARAGQTQAITLAANSANNAAAYKGLPILITAGTGAGQIGIINTYVPGTQSATLNSSWQTVPDATSQYVIVQLDPLNQLARLLYLAKAFTLPAALFQSILNHAPVFGSKKSGAADRFADLKALRQIADFRTLAQSFAQHGDATQTAFDLNAASNDPLANSAEAVLVFVQAASANTAQLAQISGWDADQITALQGHLAQMAAAAAKSKVKAFKYTLKHLASMQSCFDLAARLGIDIQLLIDLYNLHGVAEQPGAPGWQTSVSTAQAFLSVVRSKYSEADWDKNFGPIRDHVNELERDALAAYLLLKLLPQFPDIKTQQDLYEFLLVDVQMSGCAQTTYVREAIDCLQIYIQRCRMNLETGVTLSSANGIPDVLWDWMGHYRMWQANREMFFYPENYLDPTLRTQDATPEFQALQSELLQGDITQDTVEQAYIDYFDALDLLADLVIVDGCYADVVNPNSGISEATLFLLGRTATEPPVYYQRRAVLARDKNTGLLNGDIDQWSPWQKIDLNIPADQAMPLYTANRLYVFWAEQKTITDRDDQNKKITTTTVTIKFSYQQVSGKWMQPQVLPQAQDVPVTALPPCFQFDPGGPNAQFTLLFLSGSVLSQIHSSWASNLAPLVSTLVKPRSAYSVAGIPALRLYNRTPWSHVDGLPQTLINQVAVVGDRLFAGTGEGLYVSDLTAATWNLVKGGWSSNAFQYIAAVGNILVTAILSDGLWISDLTGSAWSKVSPETALSSQTVAQVAAIGDRLFAATWDSGLYSIDMGVFLNNPTAARWDKAGGMADTFVTSVASVGDRLFAATDKGVYSIDQSVFLSNPTTASWVMVDSLQNKDSYQGTLVTAVDDHLFASTETGLWVSDPAGAKWSSVTGVPHGYNVPVVAIGNRLFGAINGSGIFCIDKDAFFSNPTAPWDTVYGLQPLRALQVGAIGDRLFVATEDKGIYQSVFVIPLLHTNGDTWLALPILSTGNAPAYCVHRLTTRCVDQLRQTVVEGGLDALLTLQSQSLAETPFADLHASAQVQPPYPSDTMDFDLSSAYSLYFREIFFHIPYLIGDALQTNQHFEEAKHWFETIFNPLAQADSTDVLPADRFWQYQPFRGHTVNKLVDDIEKLQQYQAYEDDPFDPFAIAEFRLGAYEKALVMQYLDNLLDWGDSLYALDGWENLNAATTLYVLAAELLGPKPEPTQVFTQVKGSLAPKALDAGRDVHHPRLDLQDILNKASGDWLTNPFFDVPNFFFLPENDQFAGYWDKVEQRLYQIRHCMNLQGIVRQLPAYDPAIDPRQLLRALAAGRSIGAVTNRTAATVPHYRFDYLLERARQVMSELKQLGGALLSALEKQDAEQLAVLRNTYEGALLNLTTLIKQKQQEENQHSLEALQQSVAAAQARHDRYQGWATQYLSPGEQTGLSLTQTASDLRTAASVITTLSGIGYALPNIFGLADGGMNFGAVIGVAADVLNATATIQEWQGQMALSRATYDRRQADWQLQADLANFDVQQLNAQIDALQVRQTMADQELVIHQRTITQNQGISDFYTQKFTSQQLYQWMVGQLGAVYFQTYQLALDMARMVERAFQYERNTDDSYVNYNGWDGLHKGLLAGEALALNLNQLEKAYIEQNARALEIEKTISLLQLDPQALLDLKSQGKCTFNLTEQLFDYDFPGHYCRKIVSVALSVPAVVGPYQNVQATLIQHANRVVLKTDIAAVRSLLSAGQPQPAPGSLQTNVRSEQQIALSKGVNDAGMFELNFRDDRYLPFEGTGVVSTWELRMPKATNRFDFGSISDVIIQVRYTALDGGDGFSSQVTQQPQVKYYSGFRFLSLRQEYPAAWQKAANTAAGNTTFTLGPVVVNSDLFPVHLVQDSKGNLVYFGTPNPTSVPDPSNTDNMIGVLAISAPGSPAGSQPAGLTMSLNNSPVSGGQVAVQAIGPQGATWNMSGAISGDFKFSDLADIVLIIPYTGELDWAS